MGFTPDTVQRPIIHIRYGRNNLVENVRFKDTGSTAMEIVDSLYPVVRNVETGKYINDARPIQSNGVSLVSVQGGIVKDSVLNADRHAAALTGGGFIVTRFSVFEHNYLASRVTNAANFHGHEEFSGYRNNHIVSHGVAVNLAGARNFLVGNDIYEGNSASSMINWNRAVSVANLIQGNRFTMLNAHFIIDAAAATDINSDTTEDGIFKFYDNEIIDLSGANRSYIHIINNGSTADNRFEFKRNIVKRTNTGFFGNFLSMSRVSGDSFDQLIVEYNTLLNTGMGIVTGVTDFTIRGNDLTIPSNNSSPGSFTGRSGGYTIAENNTIKGGDSNTLVLAGAVSDNQKLIVARNNTIIDGLGGLSITRADEAIS